MSPLAAAAALALAPLMVVALWNLLAAPRLHRHAPSPGGPLVSVLVPARDEAENLRRLIPALLASRYGPVEVVVLNDDSQDDTLSLGHHFAGLDARVRIANGGHLPEGWTGKNWACHQLRGLARGEILVFCDADVRPGPDAIGRTVAALDALDVDVLTAFPRDEALSWSGHAVVPLVTKLPLAALLPLWLVPRCRRPGLAAGNGQWFAWRRGAYDLVGGHGVVCGDSLEDVRLARRAKAAGLRLAAMPAPSDLGVRMYGSATEVREGFSKNLYPLLGSRPETAAAGVGLFLLTMVLPFALPWLPGAGLFDWVPLVMLVAVRGAAALLFHGHLAGLILHPLGAVATAVLVVDSWWRHSRGSVVWKRRTLAPRRASD